MPPLELLHKDNLVYVGSFRVPDHHTPDSTFGYSYGGTSLAYNEFNDSLVMCGHDHKQWMGEFTIPEIRETNSISELDVADVIQPPSDWLFGKRLTVDGGVGNGVKIGGCFALSASKYVISAWTYYDAGQPKQTLSHFVVDLSTATVKGPYQVGKGWQEYYPQDNQTIAGMVSGYMCAIPTSCNSPFGTHLTGQGGGISIVTRTSSGPSATSFSGADLEDEGILCPAKLVMGYPTMGGFSHPTLGIWGKGGNLNLYDGTQYFRGMATPDGFKSVLFFGWGGSRFCYGVGTSDPSLDLQPVPGSPTVHYCYDPINGSKGTHGYPYRSIVYAYNFGDFISVVEGRLKPYEVVPYDVWDISPLPFQTKMINGVDRGCYDIVGTAYKSATGEIFVSAYRNDANRPIIHVLRVQE